MELHRQIPRGTVAISQHHFLEPSGIYHLPDSSVENISTAYGPSPFMVLAEAKKLYSVNGERSFKMTESLEVLKEEFISGPCSCNSYLIIMPFG